MTDAQTLPLSKRLKEATSRTHDKLDGRIMAARPFASTANYGRFLAVQYAFHRDLQHLYGDAALGALLPDLEARNRLGRIGEDLADLEQAQPGEDEPAPFADGPIDMATAFGWLYVAEGSNLGAAFLYKAAEALGLDADFGARHLAGHADGRARHWREFTGALDRLALSDAEEKRVVDGACAAFTRVHGLVDRHFA